SSANSCVRETTTLSKRESGSSDSGIRGAPGYAHIGRTYARPTPPIFAARVADGTTLGRRTQVPLRTRTSQRPPRWAGCTAPLALGGPPLAYGVCRLGRIASRLGRRLTGSNAVGCFFVQLLGNRCRAAHIAKRHHTHMKHRIALTYPHHVTGCDFTCRLGRLVVNLNTAGPDFTGGQASGFVKPCGP